MAGAKVYFRFFTHADEPARAVAVTDAQGRFAFALTPKQVPLSADATSSDPRQIGQIVVKADGFAFAWLTRPFQPGELEFRLARDDAPIEGRFIDLQGKPVAGLRVTALNAAAPEKGDCASFLKALKGGEAYYPALLRHLPNMLFNYSSNGLMSDLLPTTTTDAAGRFRLSGFAREQAVELRVEGAGIDIQQIFVLTGPLAPDAGRPLTPPLANSEDGRTAVVLSNRFDRPVAPGQTVIGTVREDVTNQPIAGAVVETYQLAGTNLAQNPIYHTVADGQGRYRLADLPRGKGNRIRIRPPQDQPYLPVLKDVPAAVPFVEATVDAALRRGFFVDVTAADKASGKPVPGSISYIATPPQRTFMPLPGADAYDNFMPTRTDGRLRFVAGPGKAIVAFRTDWGKYPTAPEAATIWLPSGLSPSNYQAFAEINPKPDDGPIQVKFILDTGRIVTGRLIGPDGGPVIGAMAAGLRDDLPYEPTGSLKADEFTALGLDPARPRLLGFVQRERKLAGSVVVRGDEKDPVTVRMQPWATVSGRLLDAEGRPIKNATLWFTEVPVCKRGQPMSTVTGLHVVARAAGQPDLDPNTDDQGRFRVDGLIPGLKYNLAQWDPTRAMELSQIRWFGLAFREVVLKPGETKDLGDVRLQPFPKD